MSEEKKRKVIKKEMNKRERKNENVPCEEN